MNLIVHIGQGKTGSSSIQKTLRNSQNILRNHNYEYTGLNFELAPKKIFEWQKAGSWELLRTSNDAPKQLAHVIHENIKHLRKKNITKVIWSNESLFASPELVIPALKAVQSHGVKVTIICYIRRHDAWARSAYLQWGIKHKAEAGAVKPFAEWIKNRNINFAGALAQWSDFQCEKVFIRNFDELESLLSDFLLCAGINCKEIEEVRDNDTPGNAALNLWALYNSQCEHPVLPTDLYTLFDKSGILTKNYKSVDLGELFPKHSDLVEVLSSCEADIAKVNAMFERSNQPIFTNTPLKYKTYNTDSESMICALLDIIKVQEERISRLEQQIEYSREPKK